MDGVIIYLARVDGRWVGSLPYGKLGSQPYDKPCTRPRAKADQHCLCYADHIFTTHPTLDIGVVHTI